MLFMVINDLTWVVFWVIVFSHRESIRGWERADVFVLFAVITAVYGVGLGLFHGVRRLGERIRRGELDPFLAQPRPVLVRVLFGRIHPPLLGDLAFGPMIFLCSGLAGDPVAWLRYVARRARCFAAILLAFILVIESTAFWMAAGSEFADVAFTAITVLAIVPGVDLLRLRQAHPLHGDTGGVRRQRPCRDRHRAVRRAHARARRGGPRLVGGRGRHVPVRAAALPARVVIAPRPRLTRGRPTRQFNPPERRGTGDEHPPRQPQSPKTIGPPVSDSAPVAPGSALVPVPERARNALRVSRVDASVGLEERGEAVVVARLAQVTELVVRAPEAVVRVGIHRIPVDDHLELGDRAVVEAELEVRLAERLVDRVGSRLEPLGAFEGRDRLIGAVGGERVETLPVQLVGVAHRTLMVAPMPDRVRSTPRPTGGLRRRSRGYVSSPSGRLGASAAWMPRAANAAPGVRKEHAPGPRRAELKRAGTHQEDR